jgi:hypothetical protein
MLKVDVPAELVRGEVEEGYGKVADAFRLFRAGSVDRGGRSWTLRRWSTRKRSEVRILYAPPMWPPVLGWGLAS